ncbi:MAG: hypothetical protein HOQ22_05025 [Nocardioidaceae bacterium]|nr:hypothetical protein [Nocardioidaceae bacterium]NUS50389.1 hypothetical protein [Nocardioidaceae bacterium]
MTSSGVDPARERWVALADTSLGVASVMGRVTVRVVRRTRVVATPVLRPLARPPLVPDRWQPPTLADAFRARGGLVRDRLTIAFLAVLDRLLPVLVEQVLARVDLTDVVRRHVDLDAIVAGVDLDGVVARVDVEAVVARVDLDAIAAGLDVDAVAARLDVDAVLDRLDLTDLALRRLDLVEIVNAVLANVDLATIAQQVIDEIDLPDIIRESSGALTSDTVRGARMRSAAADQAIGRVRDRLLLRRHGNGTELPTMTGAAEPPGPADRP